ncbi:MAG: hypothetical protein R3B99_16950 [Polyangiales bacterium]
MDTEGERVDVRTPDLALERAGLGLLGGAMVVHLLGALGVLGALAGWSRVGSYVLLGAALLVGWLAKRRSPLRPATWQVVDGALVESTVAGTCRLPLADVAEVELDPADESRTFLRLLDREGAVLRAARVPNREVRRRLMRLGARERATSLRVMAKRIGVGRRDVHAFMATYAVWALSQVATFDVHIGLSFVGPFLLPLVGGAAFGPNLEVGAEGVRFRRFRNRFVPFSNLDDVEVTKSKVFLRLRDGTRVKLPIDTRGRARVLRDDAVATIREALTRFRENEGAAVSLASLARGSRSVAAWIADLERQAEGDYREGALRTERLQAALDDPAAADDVRAGAAWLLARRGDRASVSAARERAVHPKVRVALDAVLSDDVEALSTATEPAKRAAVA